MGREAITKKNCSTRPYVVAPSLKTSLQSSPPLVPCERPLLFCICQYQDHDLRPVPLMPSFNDLDAHMGRRILTAAELEELDAQVARDGATLNESELQWRDKQPFLESHGYLLRPRLRPGWVPSWINKPPRSASKHEDFISLPVCKT